MSRSLPLIGEDLVALATGGDSAAVETLVRELEPPIFAIAQRMLADRRDAEDATQESLVRIVTRLNQFRGEAKFTTWAVRIAVRRILDFREQQASAARYTFQEFTDDLATGFAADAIEELDDALLHRQMKIRCTRAMLHCLDGDHRIAFILGAVLELPASEAASIVEVEPATFRKRLSRARAAVHGFLERTCSVFEPTATCSCHGRLARAIELGRIDRGRPDRIEAERGDLVQLRTHLAKLSEMRRVTAYFQADPRAGARRDFVAVVRQMLFTLSTTEIKEMT